MNLPGKRKTFLFSSIYINYLLFCSKWLKVFTYNMHHEIIDNNTLIDDIYYILTNYYDNMQVLGTNMINIFNLLSISYNLHQYCNRDPYIYYTHRI